jgi:hypothetical protein
VSKAGEPHVYSSIQKCINCLKHEVDDGYDKWLVVLTDTADFECLDDKGRVDKAAPMRAETAVGGVLGSMNTMSGACAQHARPHVPRHPKPAVSGRSVLRDRGGARRAVRASSSMRRWPLLT